jgi:hypothetical protein
VGRLGKQRISLWLAAKAPAAGPLVGKQAIARRTDTDERPFRPIEEMTVRVVDLNVTEIASLSR